MRCGICVRLCHLKAISDYDGSAVVNWEKCIGRGLCVTGCEFGVMRPERKPDNEIIDPPKDFATWEDERLKNRGIKF
jgi:Fe-S-cluster-containing hydrogenase component 2